MAPESKLETVNGEFYRDHQDERDGQDISTRGFLSSRGFLGLPGAEMRARYRQAGYTPDPRIEYIEDAIALPSGPAF